MSISELQAFKAEFFRALAHPVRIRILETLTAGERSVQDLQAALRIDQPVVSQQLAILRAKNIVTGRKEGTTVRYSVRDPLVADLLDVARRIFNNQLVGTRNLLRELQREERRR
jgi:DNA-binding transcriptional ArsR family regulator